MQTDIIYTVFNYYYYTGMYVRMEGMNDLLLKADFVMVGAEDDLHDLEGPAQAERTAHRHAWVGQGVWYAATSLEVRHCVQEGEVLACRNGI